VRGPLGPLAMTSATTIPMPDATAMAVRDGTVAWLGRDDVGRTQFPDAEVVALDGGFVAPAFVDSHVHLTATGLSLTGLDLRAATSSRHCLQLIAEHAATHPGGPIWAYGWDESGWPEATPPSTADVDGVVGDRPAYLARVDAHSAAASTALRRMAPGLTAAAGFDAQRPLTADAHHLVRAAARERLTPAQLTQARVAALDHAAANGIVAVHECAGPDIGGLDDWRELRGTSHGVDIIGYWGEAVGTAEQAGALIAATGVHGLAGDLFVDGALGSRTAWLREPYTDGPDGCGNSYLDRAAITAHLHACTEAGITAGFHVIGDAAVTAVVDALQRGVVKLGAAAVARCRHRLEHLEMVTAEQAGRLGAWGVIASVQPNFDALWGGEDGMYAQRLGPHRAGGARVRRRRSP
jgi:predicted amidohydrolase YtcJ